MKPVNEEHTDVLNSWIVKNMLNNTSCEFKKMIDLMEINHYKVHINVLMVKALNSVVTQRKNTIYVYAGLIKQWIR